MCFHRFQFLPLRPMLCVVCGVVGTTGRSRSCRGVCIKRHWQRWCGGAGGTGTGKAAGAGSGLLPMCLIWRAAEFSSIVVHASAGGDWCAIGWCWHCMFLLSHSVSPGVLPTASDRAVCRVPVPVECRDPPSLLQWKSRTRCVGWSLCVRHG